MKVLAIETATSCLSVAVLDEERVLATCEKEATGRHAREIIPAIDRVLHSAGCALSDLDGFAVSIGPGSFTGLRVGLATVMGFRMITGLPVAAVSTLEAMAWNLREMPLLNSHCVCPVLKCRHGEVYWASYQWRDRTTLVSKGDERVGSLENLAESVAEPAVFYGEGWEANRDALRSIFTLRKQSIIEAPAEAGRASAASVGLAGIERLMRGEVASPGLAPRYIQRAEAELVMERRTAGCGRAQAGMV